MKFRVGRFTCEVLLSDDGKPLVRWAPERPKYLNRAERDQYQAGLAEFLERLNPSVLALTEDSPIVETVRVCADEDAGMHLAVS